MANKASVRLQWAVETLAVEPDDRLLEIGCGQGVAVSLVCAKLAGGHITAIDRSVKMADMARKRNAQHVASGKAAVLAVDLDEADFGEERFNKIFASHVNVFWQRPEEVLAIVRRLLTAGGTLYLFFQPLDPSSIDVVATRAFANLEANGFTAAIITAAGVKGGPMVCLVAQDGWTG